MTRHPRADTDLSAVSQTGNLAISGCNDKKLRLYDLDNIDNDPQIIELPVPPQVCPAATLLHHMHDQPRRYTLPNPTRCIWQCIRFSPDDSQIVVVSQDAPTLW